MNLPHKWSVLQFNSSDHYYFGVDYSKVEFHYTLYLTDFKHFWICDCDESKIKLKALENGIQLDSINGIYLSLIESFDKSFNDETDEENVKTVISLNRLKIDRGTPLELKLHLVKSFTNNQKLNWNFEFILLPDSSSISILSNMFFQSSTILYSLFWKNSDINKLFKQKDSAISFLIETLQSLNAGHLLTKWAPENSKNANTIKSFESDKFNQLWKLKKLQDLNNRYIWDVLEQNSQNDSWSYSASFKDELENDEADGKNNLIQDTKRPHSDESDEFEKAEDNDDNDESNLNKKRRITNDINNLSQDFEQHDIKPKDPSINLSQPSSQAPSPSTQTKSQSPEKPKRSFGISRKRSVRHSSFSPIKAAKHFQSDD